MRYEGTVYRPPSEAGSLLIQATIGCPHNKCRFCGMYKDKRFRIRKLADIMEDLTEAGNRFGSGVRTLFLPDGNTIIMKTAGLLQILEKSKEVFPALERITLYGAAKYLAHKTLDELKTLRRAGLSRVHMGLESGDDETLLAMKKGATAAESAAAGKKVREAGLELSVYYLVGIGGRRRLIEHALASARAVNAMNPDFIRLRTYFPVESAPLYEDIQNGDFELPSAHEALRELELLISNIETSSLLLSDHISNYLNLSGQLPEDKPDLLKEIKNALECDESRYHRRIMHL